MYSVCVFVKLSVEAETSMLLKKKKTKNSNLVSDLYHYFRFKKKKVMFTSLSFNEIKFFHWGKDGGSSERSVVLL